MAFHLREAHEADIEPLARLHVQTPSNGFYEAFGAERLYGPAGEFSGGYGWRDLNTLVTRCGL